MNYNPKHQLTFTFLFFSIQPENFKQEGAGAHNFHQQGSKQGQESNNGGHYKQPLRSLPVEPNTGHIGHPYADHAVTSIKTEQPDYSKYNYSNRYNIHIFNY